MKAMVLRAAGPVDSRPLALEDTPRPLPGPREVLVRVLCCGVCHTDLHTVEGDIVPPHLPVIPGHQAEDIHLISPSQIDSSPLFSRSTLLVHAIAARGHPSRSSIPIAASVHHHHSFSRFPGA